jgi:hypothetical protein
MNTNLPIVLEDSPLALEKRYFDQYSTLDERQDLYAELKKAAATTSWMQADFFKYLWNETKSQKTLIQFARDFGEHVSTVRNYLRTSEAFPLETRNPMLSFSHHFQAWQIDGYDEKTHTFASSKRFDWVQKAADNNWSSKQLYENVMRQKQIKDNKGKSNSCSLPNCNITNIPTYPVNVYNRRLRKTEHLDYHELCYQVALSLIRRV